MKRVRALLHLPPRCVRRCSELWVALLSQGRWVPTSGFGLSKTLRNSVPGIQRPWLSPVSGVSHLEGRVLGTGLACMLVGGRGGGPGAGGKVGGAQGSWQHQNTA